MVEKDPTTPSMPRFPGHPREKRINGSHEKASTYCQGKVGREDGTQPIASVAPPALQAEASQSSATAAVHDWSKDPRGSAV